MWLVLDPRYRLVIGVKLPVLVGYTPHPVWGWLWGGVGGVGGLFGAGKSAFFVRRPQLLRLDSSKRGVVGILRLLAAESNPVSSTD